MNKKLNFNVPCLGLDQKPIINNDKTTQTLGQLYANVISCIQQGDATVLMDWANSIYQNQPLSVDEKDLQVLIQIANQCPLPALLRVQILKILQG